MIQMEGLEDVMKILITMILLIIVAAVFWYGIYGKGEPIEIEEEESKHCKIPNDCKGNVDGLLCIQAMGGNYCGCTLTSSNWEEDQCLAGYECDKKNKKCYND